MSDEIDSANDRAQLALDVAILNHQRRPAAELPICQHCEERSVFVASNGCAWKYCAGCADELGLARQKGLPEAA